MGKGNSKIPRFLFKSCIRGLKKIIDFTCYYPISEVPLLPFMSLAVFFILGYEGVMSLVPNFFEPSSQVPLFGNICNWAQLFSKC